MNWNKKNLFLLFTRKSIIIIHKNTSSPLKVYILINFNPNRQKLNSILYILVHRTVADLGFSW